MINLEFKMNFPQVVKQKSFEKFKKLQAIGKAFDFF